MLWASTGGIGGIPAALAALRMGRKVILTKEYKWLGGQLAIQLDKGLRPKLVREDAQLLGEFQSLLTDHFGITLE